MTRPTAASPSRRRGARAVMGLAVLLTAAAAAGCRSPAAEAPPPATATPQRVVSLAPSITEVLFALGLEGRVAGVTRYCDYPPQALLKPRVGGYFDINYEALLALEPDLVILLSEHTDAMDRLEELGVPVMAVNHSRVAGILDSITAVGARLDAGEEAARLRRRLEERIEQVRRQVAGRRQGGLGIRSPGSGKLSAPRVMVAVGRLMDRGSGGDIYISGRDGFYDDLIRLAGGVNAYRDETLKFPAISAEGLVRLDPDVIIEMVPDSGGEADRQRLLELWRDKPGVRAVRQGRVHILYADYVVVPGPRFVDLLEDMSAVIRPVSAPAGEAGQRP